MDLSQTGLNFGVPLNNLFSGYYSFNISANRKRLFNFSSPNYSINTFDQPYDAKLTQNNNIVGVGEATKLSCGFDTDRSGVLEYFDNSTLYGACFGIDLSATIDNLNPTYYNGFNYYNSPYPAGYFSPFYGENFSIFKSNILGYGALQNGGCLPISVTEYNEIFGIVSSSSSESQIVTDTLAANIYSLLQTPQVVCPPAATIPVYFNEINFSQIPGTTLALGAGTTFNDNSIPTSLDNFIYKINGRYELVKDSGYTDQYPIMDIVFQNGRAVPSYNSSNTEDKLNNLLCQATIMETSVSANVGNNGSQLINAPDLTIGGPGSQVIFSDQIYSYYWNFLYRENAYSLPFNNYNSNPSSVPGEPGTELFNPILSSTDYFWKYRQCPSIVDFLPWTLGASIYACPSNFFEIPYYAANKKFGFYGTRFLNTCKSLNLQYNIGNVPNASEIDLTINPYKVYPPNLEPPSIDSNGNWNFSMYDNLLNVANDEENYSNMYAFNKGFFLWVNSGNLLNDNLYKNNIYDNINNTGNSGFNYEVLSLFGKFTNIFTGGLYSLTGNSPNILLYKNAFGNNIDLITSTGIINQNILSTNNIYQDFSNTSFPLLNSTQLYNWHNLENKYGYAVLDNYGNLNQNFYQNIISGKQSRIITRYFENLLRGNPIDLYPTNNIGFSMDSASGYLQDINWGRSIASFGNDSLLPTVNKRYFYGAYGESSSLNSLENVLNNLINNQTNYYYPGFFNNINCTNDSINPKYDIVTGGLILDNLNRPFSTLGWMAIGYNEIGKLNKNFSCFTPIFIQQPVPEVFCKIGQAPTFRSMAVDYHTLPEDKISRQYPEIMYWAVKLKLLDCNNNYLYPMKYKWARVFIDDYEDFISSPFSDPSLIDYSNSTGDWCCLEGDTQNCTLIHPLDCYPIYNTGNKNLNSYTFLKGADIPNYKDDQYYYFTIATGRFGVRISNLSSINIEDWVAFDISFKNGANVASQLGVNFIIQDYSGNMNTISIPQVDQTPIAPYRGYEFDNTSIPESAIQQKVPPPNAGYGDVTSYKFIGSTLYRGELTTFTPSYLNDTRGLYETWGRLIGYGPLIQFYSELNQTEGDLLYGYQHLPTCTNYQMNPGQQGVKTIFTVNGYNIQQFTIPQQALAALDINQGIPYQNIGTIGNLYPPILDTQEIGINFDIGNSWQFAQNLGTIKRFGFSSNINSNDVVMGYSFAGDTPTTLSQVIYNLKTQVLKPTDLAGNNCGYTPYGAGRFLGYYVEAYDSFYTLCNVGLKDNQNIQDLNFISPGYRMGNSSIQYNWLGKPYNTYLDRRPLYGPYAYKWRVNRHNRDRNGNGISEGFYSMPYGELYSLMYDLPSVFGLYIRTPQPNLNYINNVNIINNQRYVLYNMGLNILNLPNITFGTIMDPGQEGVLYGNINWTCDYPNALCNYMNNSLAFANNPNFGDYSCPQNLLINGQCFDPCLSQRYAHGFFPGGKSLDLFGNNNGKYTKLIPMATVENGNVRIGDEVSIVNPNVTFRSPNSTPHYFYSQQNDEGNFEQDNNINGINACSDGSSDFCSYTTPTVFLNSMFSLLGKTTSFNSLVNQAVNLFDENS